MRIRIDQQRKRRNGGKARPVWRDVCGVVEFRRRKTRLWRNVAEDLQDSVCRAVDMRGKDHAAEAARKARSVRK